MSKPKTLCVDCSHAFADIEKHMKTERHIDKAKLNEIRRRIQTLPKVVDVREDKYVPAHPPKGTPEYREWNLKRQREYAKENKEHIQEYQRQYRLKRKCKTIIG